MKRLDSIDLGIKIEGLSRFSNDTPIASTEVTEAIREIACILHELHLRIQELKWRS